MKIWDKYYALYIYILVTSLLTLELIQYNRNGIGFLHFSFLPFLLRVAIQRRLCLGEITPQGQLFLNQIHTWLGKELSRRTMLMCLFPERLLMSLWNLRIPFLNVKNNGKEYNQVAILYIVDCDLQMCISSTSTSLYEDAANSLPVQYCQGSSFLVLNKVSHFFNWWHLPFNWI